LESSENIGKRNRRTSEIVDNFSKNNTIETSSENLLAPKIAPLKPILKKPKSIILNVENQLQIEQTLSEDRIQVNASEELNESDEQILKLIKNRLAALTLVGKNLMQMDQLSEEYQLKKETLMNDYFGFSSEANQMAEFNFDEMGKKEELFKNLDIIRVDLENVMKRLHSKENTSKFIISSYDSNLKMVPKALMALKYKVPMLFINKLYCYLSNNMLETNETSEISNKNVLIDKENILKFKEKNEVSEKESLSKFLPHDKEFYNSLIELQKKLFANRKDLNKMVEILGENKNTQVRKLEINIFEKN